jgi:hypothetical protein
VAWAGTLPLPLHLPLPNKDRHFFCAHSEDWSLMYGTRVRRLMNYVYGYNFCVSLRAACFTIIQVALILCLLVLHNFAFNASDQHTQLFNLWHL